jgi:hypothetical protein
VTAPSPVALRIVRSLSTLWRLGLQPGTYAEETAARLVDTELGEAARAPLCSRCGERQRGPEQLCVGCMDDVTRGNPRVFP